LSSTSSAEHFSNKCSITSANVNPMIIIFWIVLLQLLQTLEADGHFSLL
jgi:hypothetical protein